MIKPLETNAPNLYVLASKSPEELLELSHPEVTPDDYSGMVAAEEAYKKGLKRVYSFESPASDMESSLTIQAANWAERRAVQAHYARPYSERWHGNAVNTLAKIATGNTDKTTVMKARNHTLAMHSASMAIRYLQSGKFDSQQEAEIAAELQSASTNARSDGLHILATNTLRNQATFEAIAQSRSSLRAGRIAMLGMGNSLKLGNEVAASRQARLLIKLHEFKNNAKAFGVAVTTPLAGVSSSIGNWRQRTAKKLIY